MEPMDYAEQRLSQLIAEIKTLGDSIFTEQDTRLKVVDQMLCEVLGWPLKNIFTESQSGTGFIDYRLDIGPYARLIVEAKRDNRSLGISIASVARTYNLNGSLFREKTANEGIEQCISYCGRKNAELACVTNGREWIIFRGSRAGDGIDTREGKAFVFPSLETLKEKFALFYTLLGYENVKDYKYQALFQEAEGQRLRRSTFRKSLRNPATPQLITSGGLSADLDRVLFSFFRRLTGDDDPEMLDKCFVVTKESETAERRIARISEDLVRRIHEISTDRAGRLSELIERVKSTQRHEFVLLIGTKGAGKTTFIHRFFRTILAKDLSKQCVVIRINLEDSDGDDNKIIAWLNRKLLEIAEQAVYGDRLPSFEEVKGMFFGTYERMKNGTLRPLYERDKQAFDIKFGEYVEDQRQNSPHDYICSIIGNVVRSRKKVPCLIFDNADHFTIEFQERVFQYARSIYENELCLVILPITDRTSWQITAHGATESFESEALYLPTPSPKRIIERRIRYLQEQIAAEKRETGRGYLFGKGINLSLSDLTGFASALQNIFLETGHVSRIIDNLSNRNIRHCLELTRAIASSPHIEVPELLKAYVVGVSSPIPPYKITRAIIKGQYDIYPEGQNKFVQNIYLGDEEADSSPLLTLRILQYLSDVRISRTKRFVEVSKLIQYFQAMQCERSVIVSRLARLLKNSLCFSYDPTIIEIEEARMVEISPSGFQHLYWGLRDDAYIQAMMQVTPILEEKYFDDLEDLSTRPLGMVWLDELKVFIGYLIDLDSRYCVLPEHESYTGQRKLTVRLQGLLDTLLARRSSRKSIYGREYGVTDTRV